MLFSNIAAFIALVVAPATLASPMPSGSVTFSGTPPQRSGMPHGGGNATFHHGGNMTHPHGGAGAGNHTFIGGPGGADNSTTHHFSDGGNSTEHHHPHGGPGGKNGTHSFNGTPTFTFTRTGTETGLPTGTFSFSAPPTDSAVPTTTVDAADRRRAETTSVPFSSGVPKGHGSHTRDFGFSGRPHPSGGVKFNGGNGTHPHMHHSGSAGGGSRMMTKTRTWTATETASLSA